MTSPPAPRADRLARAALLACSRRRARDFTTAELRASALVVAPHPDDEVLGCGALIARKRQLAAPVTIAVLTDGGHSHDAHRPTPEIAAARRMECVAAAAVLGVDDVVFLGVEDGRLADAQATASERLAELVADRAPAQLFAPCAWEGGGDHAAARRIAIAAAKRAPAPAELYEYAVWFWDRWPWTRGAGRRPGAAAARALAGAWRLAAGFDRRLAVGELTSAKRAALERHVTQVHRPPEHPDWPVLADLRGGALLARWLGDLELFRHAPARGRGLKASGRSPARRLPSSPGHARR